MPRSAAAAITALLAACAATPLTHAAPASSASTRSHLPVVLAAPPASSTRPLPVVLWHGMGDSCCNPRSMGAVSTAIKSALGPGSYVLSLSFGGGGGGQAEAADVAAGFFGRVDEQVAHACEAIAADPVLQASGAYNAVGFSQGGQFLRAVAQRCGGNGDDEGQAGRRARPALRRLITLGAQHQGVASLPLCPLPRNASAHAWSLCAAAAALAAVGVDAPLVRTHLVQAQYWKDPAHVATYRRLNAFLADINNEHACDAPPPEDGGGMDGGGGGPAGPASSSSSAVSLPARDARPPPEGGNEGGSGSPSSSFSSAPVPSVRAEPAPEGGDGAVSATPSSSISPSPTLPTRCPNPAYAPALAALDRFVMVRFVHDVTVVPRDSAWFADVAIAADGGVTAVPLRETALYKEDWIGLRRLDSKGALYFEDAPGGHMQFSIDWFVDRVVKRHLMDGGRAEEVVGSGGGVSSM